MVRNANERPTVLPTEELQTLVLALQNADESIAQTAFDRLYERYSAIVWRTALGIVKRTEIADEIKQQTFQKVWERRTQLKVDSNVPGLLTTISKRLALDHIKSPRNASSDPDALVNLTADEITTVDALITHEELQAYQRARQQLANELTPQKIAMIDAYYLHEKTADEIATEQGVPVATVRTIVRRARLRLQTLVTEADTVLSPAAVDAQTGDRLALEQAIRDLPNATAAEALRLQLIDNLPIKEIATQLQRSPNAVGLLLSRYRRILAEHMGGEIPELHSITPRLDTLIRTDRSAAVQLIQSLDHAATRTTLLRHLVDGLNGSQIAKENQEPENTVRVRIARGKDQLETKLAKEQSARYSNTAV